MRDSPMPDRAATVVRMIPVRVVARAGVGGPVTHVGDGAVRAGARRSPE
ncbi:hypothetical protein [Embleya sp. NBC_00896]|nr:hypothetical protein OG928_17775 [Embleya sp. NBC_00896]